MFDFIGAPGSNLVTLFLTKDYSTLGPGGCQREEMLEGISCPHIVAATPNALFDGLCIGIAMSYINKIAAHYTSPVGDIRRRREEMTPSCS